VRLWRIAREPYCLDRVGTGAFLFGGRWTPPGVRILHAAGSISLAALEYLVHSPKPPLDLVLVSVDVPDDAPVHRPKIDELPDDWASPLPSEHCQTWGANWCKGATALGLAVPSVIESPKATIARVETAGSTSTAERKGRCVTVDVASNAPVLV